MCMLRLHVQKCIGAIKKGQIHRHWEQWVQKIQDEGEKKTKNKTKKQSKKPPKKTTHTKQKTKLMSKNGPTQNRGKGKGEGG